jgi:X-X-X-Leu-X-X-Gly heptad repeat protein
VLDQLKAKAKTKGGEIEHFAKSVGYGIETVVTKMASLFGLYLTFDGFARMVEQTTQLQAGVGQLATTLGMTTEEASQLQQALKLIPNANPQSFFDTIKSMNNSLAWWRSGGPRPPWLAWVQQLGVTPSNDKQAKEIMGLREVVWVDFEPKPRRGVIAYAAYR